MKTIRSVFAIALVCAAGALLPARSAIASDDSAVRKAMEDEMARSLAELHLGSEPAPYFLRYTLIDEDSTSMSARLGATVTSDHEHDRRMRVDARVGSANEDNSNFSGGGFSFSMAPFGGGMVSREDDYQALRQNFWQLTDREYKRALETLAKKKASHAVEAADKDKVADFVTHAPLTSVTDHAVVPSEADHAKLKDLVLRLSKVFSEYPTVNSGRVDGSARVVRRRLLSSEKTWTDERHSFVRIGVNGETTADDGSKLTAAIAFTAIEVGALPSIERMEADVRALAKSLADERTAPNASSGSATVLFEGPAAGQLVKMLLATPLSGQPAPKTGGGGGGGFVIIFGDAVPESASLADKLGQTIAPKWFSAYDDPTALGPDKRVLFGSYDTDDEGIAAERVSLIEGGTIKSLLMSRAPRKQIARSNGHGRQAWYMPAARAGAASFFVSSSKALARPALVDVAVKSAGAKGTVYIVRQLGDGSGKSIAAPIAFRLDNGKETPIRGLMLEGMVPKKLKDLVAAGKDPFVWESESSGAPMSIVTPALVLQDVDVAKSTAKIFKGPLYASPIAISAKGG